MHDAVIDKLIESAPTVRIVLPKRSQRSKLLHVPTPEEVAALAGAVAPWYEPVVWTIAGLGLRPGEAIGLTVERVNFLKREIVIDRQLATFVGVGPVLVEPKTDSGYRTLHPPQEILDRLAAHIDERGPFEIEPGARLIFTGRTGTPIRRNNLADTWNRAAGKIGLRPELRGWHSLRHYAITRMIAAGVNPDYVRQIAGHESLRETLEVYSGWWPSDADDAREALSAALDEIRTGTHA